MTTSEPQISGFHLSPQQRDLWARRGDPGWQRCVVRLHGEVDPARLGRALSTVLAEHEALRTRFRRPSWMKVPLQVVEEPRPVVLEVREEPEDRLPEPRDQARQAPEEEVEEFTAQLVPGGDGEHLLILTAPALCADAWTLDLVVSETADAYAAGGRREDAGEDDGALQYVQYSEWLHGVLEEGAPEADEHWRSLARLAPPPLADAPWATALRTIAAAERCFARTG